MIKSLNCRLNGDNVRSKVIENSHIRVGVILIISIWRILDVIPFRRWINILIEERIFWFTFVIHGIETYYLQ